MAVGISSEPGTLMQSNVGARLLQRLGRAGKKRIGNVVVKARLDDEDARAFAVTSLRLPCRGPAIACSRSWRRS